MSGKERSLDYKISRCLLMMIAFFGIASYIMVVDVCSVPVKGRLYDLDQLRSDPVLWRAVNKSRELKHFEDPSRFWEWDLGNHFVSNIENAVMYVMFLWGWMRTVDLLRLFHDRDLENRWHDFWERVENL